jgi:hypothetical protein
MIAHPYFRRPKTTPRTGAIFPPQHVATRYNFPLQFTGAGQTIGLIELGGGFMASDISTFFAGQSLPVPSVTAVGVDGATNVPGGDPEGADVEVALDIQVAGSVAPGAKIMVFFAPNTTQGFVDAILAAVSAGCTVISISWGAAEDQWAPAEIAAMDAAFQAAAAAGCTVCVAAGDNGSSDGETGLHVDYPASSPYVLACGGTSLTVNADGSLNEAVWNDGTLGGATGGGVSAAETQPNYQVGLKVPATGRAVPDLAGNADPNTGYVTLVDGASLVVGGTSAVAPLFAGLVALLNQGLGKNLGQLNARLYALAGRGIVDITSGTNGVYAAGPGFDLCSGWGRPDGGKLLAALAPAAPPVPPMPPPVPAPPPAATVTVTLSGALSAGVYTLTKIATAIVLAALFVGGAAAQTKTMIFAKNNRTRSMADKVNDVTQWGQYRLDADGTAQFHATNYVASLNKKPLNTTVRHPLYFPGTKPGFIQTANPTSTTNVNGTWTNTGGVLRIVVGITAHEWVKSPTDSGLWIARGPNKNATDGTAVIQGLTYLEGRGYAAETLYPVVGSPIAREALASYYVGEEQTLISGAKSWIVQPVSWHTSWYTYGSGNVLGYDAYHADVRGGTWAFSTFLLNYYAANRIVLASDGGFDYNHDKTPDEPKHTFTYQMVWDGAKVTRIIGAQHFAQNNFYPILSVIHYKAQ